MFQTFTGTSRRPRQVNLSGRNSNPFAVAQQKSTPQGSPAAVLHAQQERKARQQDRERLQAARVIQKNWRAHNNRERSKAEQRKRWDLEEQEGAFDPLSHLNLLLQFVSPRQEHKDAERIRQSAASFNDQQGGTGTSDPVWSRALTTFTEKVLEVLQIFEYGSDKVLINFLQQFAAQTPDRLASLAYPYYTTLTKMLSTGSCFQEIQKLLGLPLETSLNRRLDTHKGLLQLLAQSWLHEKVDLDELAKSIDARYLSLALRDYLRESGNQLSENSTWLLAHYIYLYRKSIGNIVQNEKNGPSRIRMEDDEAIIAHVSNITTLMSEMTAIQKDMHNTASSLSLPAFIQQQVETLVDQNTIASLLTHIDIPSAQEGTSDFASVLASYVLTLIQVFPRRSDEIRMWLYLGSASLKVNGLSQRLPAIKFFWQAVTNTHVFNKVAESTRGSIELLSPKQRRFMSIKRRATLDQEWRLILLFLELYTFVLKIMDDDEFMSGGIPSTYPSWTRQSALELGQVKDLTIFLKNLAFIMYWYVSEIKADDEPVESHSLKNYFSGAESLPSTIQRSVDPDPLIVSGVRSSSLSYMKGTVTGLLRMLYERDSRRRFLPTDHWLMKDFDMAGFISAVLQEQRHKEEHNEEMSDDDDMVDDGSDNDREGAILVGNQRTQQIRRAEQIRKQQQRASRRRKMEETVPRLNILENMPFFIPFETRVQIFREFVRSDQQLRRNGFIDPDQWRMSVMHHGNGSLASREEFLRKRSAKVRREHVLEDAFDQFYSLGESLKEPIQITFVDQFDTPEAGIDGGGVTKEFLTSVTNEAFKEGGLKLFVENDQHLLYPNPSILDQRKALLAQSGMIEGSAEWDTQIRSLLQRYEFMGRIVGKCLYEGILIDVHFAPFFLVKWALTGGNGSATNESGYRANINDLRDLDEELYEGLLKLKNYPGNVEDFGLDFTITDSISDPTDSGSHETITKELRANGASIPVTNENRLVYISYVARHRLQLQPRLQTNAFLRGLGCMIQPSWLSMFNPSELGTLVGGDASEIDVADLRKNTLYGGVYVIGDDHEEHPTVKLFWEVIQELSDEERRKFLKYVTSTPRAPLLGFSQLKPPFSIRDSGSDQARLPSTSTCVNLLKLPIYRNKTTIREKLLYAINAGAGFNLS
jgi:ubiquitin-protein ligase E3 C